MLGAVGAPSAADGAGLRGSDKVAAALRGAESRVENRIQERRGQNVDGGCAANILVPEAERVEEGMGVPGRGRPFPDGVDSGERKKCIRVIIETAKTKQLLVRIRRVEVEMLVWQLKNRVSDQ